MPEEGAGEGREDGGRDYSEKCVDLGLETLEAKKE
jgi:hypothetical protein